jgi:hypothetical protein
MHILLPMGEKGLGALNAIAWPTPVIAALRHVILSLGLGHAARIGGPVPTALSDVLYDGSRCR